VHDAIWDSDAPIERQISSLQRAGLIVETARLPEREFAFKHELTRDAAYASMLRRRCRQFHRVVGGAIETLFPDRIEEQAHRLAYHFGEAGDDDSTLKYSTIAGDQSLRMYANNEAAAHYARGIASAKTLGAPPEQFIYLYTRKVAALQEAGRFEELADDCKELEALGVEMGEPAMELEAIIPLAVVYSTFTRVRDQPLGENVSERALELARELKDHRAEAKALWLLMLLNSMGGSDIARAVEYGEQSLAIARDNGFREETAYALNDLARAYQQSGRPDLALKHQAEAREMWRQMEIMPMLIDSLIGSAMTRYEMGSSSLALEASEEALRICDEIGNLWGPSAALGGTLMPLLDQGEPGKAISALEEAVHLANESGFVGAIAVFWSILTWSYTVVGLVDAGMEAIEQATADSDETSEIQELVHLLRGYLLLLSGDRVPAEEFINLAVGDLDTGALDPTLGGYLGAYGFFPSIVIGEVLWESERFERLIEFSDLAIESIKERQVKRYVDDMLRLKGGAQYELGRHEDARATLTQGLELARQYESKRNQWPILDMLGRVEHSLGNETHGAELRSEARRIVQEIADASGRPEIREGFFGLPRVRELMLSR
jgi:tetratricopeptide (TPR) repeat protein